MSTPYEQFLKKYPAFGFTISIDHLRAADYTRLDDAGHVYLDYTGAGIYAESQIKAHHKLLLENVYGNPHSSNPTSITATQLVDSTRAHVLQYFNAPPDEYDVIFTANASAGLKLVGESYPFTAG